MTNNRPIQSLHVHNVAIQDQEYRFEQFRGRYYLMTPDGEQTGFFIEPGHPVYPTPTMIAYIAGYKAGRAHRDPITGVS